MKQLFLVWCVIGAVAQVAGAPQDSSSPASPTFEVATVKPNKSGDRNQFIQRQPGGRVAVTNMPLRGLITFAYQLATFQLIGGPSWIASDRFGMVAKLEGNQEFPPPGSGPDPIQVINLDLPMHDPVCLSRATDGSRLAERYRDGRALLAGDAAHVHWAYGGKGPQTGLQSAGNLG